MLVLVLSPANRIFTRGKVLSVVVNWVKVALMSLLLSAIGRKAVITHGPLIGKVSLPVSVLWAKRGACKVPLILAVFILNIWLGRLFSCTIC